MMWALLLKFWYVPVMAVMALGAYAAWQRGNAKAAALEAKQAQVLDLRGQLREARVEIKTLHRHQRQTEQMVTAWRERQQRSMNQVHELAMTIRNAATDNTAYAACMDDKIKLPDDLREQLQAVSTGQGDEAP